MKKNTVSEDEANELKEGIQQGLNKPPRLIPLTRWNEHHNWPPLGGLRHLAFHAKRKGCEQVFVRCGRKVLVNEEKFFEFVERENRSACS